MTIADLPLLNASINSVVALLLLIGLVLIKSGRRTAHKRAMVAALALSALFLVSYVTYHLEHGSTKFRGQGAVRSVYFTILITHTVLAVVNLPFVFVTVWRALKGQFTAHARIAKITWAIWFYVAVTGPVVYWMLYRMDPGTASAASAVQVPAEASRRFDEARKLHQAQKDEQALAAYRQAEALGSRPAGCYAAVLEGRLRGTDTASQALSRALREDPNDPHCLVLSARELVYQDRADAAIPVLERVTKAVPGDAFFLASLGFAHFTRSNYREAAAAFERSVALDPSMSSNVYNAGYAYFLAGDYKRARPLIARALELGLDSELAERAKTDLETIDGSVWLCPMHPDENGKPGAKCSRCGMALEPASHGLSEDP